MLRIRYGIPRYLSLYLTLKTKRKEKEKEEKEKKKTEHKLCSFWYVT